DSIAGFVAGVGGAEALSIVASYLYPFAFACESWMISLLHAGVILLGFVFVVGSSISQILNDPSKTTMVLLVAYLFLSAVMELPFYMAARMTQTTSSIKPLQCDLQRITIPQEVGVGMALGLYLWSLPARICVVSSVQISLTALVIVVLALTYRMYAKATEELHGAYVDVAKSDSGGTRNGNGNGNGTVLLPSASTSDKVTLDELVEP